MAVWLDDDDRVTVLPPCGRCREFIRQIDDSNLGATVVLGHGGAAPLRDLLPEWGWPRPEEPTSPR